MIKTLNTKFSLALLAVVLTVGAGAMMIGQRGIHLYYEELTQKLNASIAMYVTDSQKLMEDQTSRDEAFKLLANRAMIINPAVEVYLLDKNGGIVSHALKGGELQRSHIALEPVLQFIAGDAQYPIRAGDPRNSSVDKIFSAAEVTSDNDLQGYLYVVLGGKIYDDIGEGIAWSHVGGQMFLSLLIVVVSSILVGLLIFRLLILRLDRLTVNMTDFALTELG